jgi:hypothetical protein
LITDTLLKVGLRESDGIGSDESTARFDIGLNTDGVDLRIASKVHSNELVSDHVRSRY